MQKDLRCSKCGSSQTRLRIKTGDRICYSCGNVWTVIEEEDDNGC